MKAILEFTLPDDNTDFSLATNGHKWFDVAWEMDQYFRTRLKYEDNISDEAYAAVEQAREKLRELIADNSISLND